MLFHAVIVLFVANVACHTTAQADAGTTNDIFSYTAKHEQAVTKALEDPQRHLSYFNHDPALPLAERHAEMNETLLAWHKRFDSRTNYANSVLSDEDRKVIAEAFALLPPRTREVLQERLVAFYFLDNYLGSGLTDWIVDEENNVYAYIVFNPKTLRTTLSEWVSKKENTAFIRNKGEEVVVDVGEGGTGFYYILLHESTHAVDYVTGQTPYVEIYTYVQTKRKGNMAFVKDIWNAYAKPVDTYTFPLRDRISFYGMGGGPHIPFADAHSVYADLTTTPFCSLYASLSWAEDLAEYLTFYHLTEKDGRPYTVSLVKDGKTNATFSPMAGKPVRARAPIIERTFYTTR